MFPSQNPAKGKFLNLKKGEGKSITILATELESNLAIFDMEYTRFKVACLDSSGLPLAAVLSAHSASITPEVLLQIFEKDGQAFEMVPAQLPFIWNIVLQTGVDRIALVSDLATTDDVVFQVTPYEAVES